MKYAEFFNRIKAVYGEYENQQVKKLVVKFVQDNWQESELEDLFSELVLTFSTQFKNQPDVSTFNDIFNKRINLKAETAWYQLSQLKTVRSIICTDIVVQETIKNMGGIDIFLDYRDRENNWCRKDFIERYSRLYSSDFVKNQKVEIIKCEMERLYPKYPPESFYDDVIVIGDQDRGRLLLEDIKKECLQIEYKYFEDRKRKPQNKEDMIHISKVLNV